MAAEIIENVDGITAESQDLSVDTQAMSPDQLIQEFEGQDTTQDLHQSTVEPEAEDLPEKYRGKSLKDLAAMHQEAERAIGRQGSEVGELRKIVDDYITTQIQRDNQIDAVLDEPEDVDFFENPQEAVSRAIESHPDVQAARQAAVQATQTQSLQALQNKHPDAQHVLTNPAFLEWVRESQIRTELFARADQSYDFNAADELLSTFKERNQVVQQTAQAEQQSRKQQIAQASTGGTASGANTGGSKKMYRRADIIKLMKNDPDRYEALSGEIMQAYAEGRVR